MWRISSLDVLRFREAVWLVPFACIVLVALSTMRVPVKLPEPARGRVVVDGAGKAFRVALPFRGTVLMWGGDDVQAYLEHTRAPDTLLRAGASSDRARFKRSFMGRLYPKLAAHGWIWDRDSIFPSHGSREEIETLFQYDPSAYLGTIAGSTPLLRRLGFPALLESDHEANWDETLYSRARVEAALIGQPERGAALIARYRQAFVDLARDFPQSTLSTRPRVLIMGSYDGRGLRTLYVKNLRNDYRIYFAPAGVVNAADQDTSERGDPERILKLNPDMIFLMGGGQTPNDFANDVRWRGLTAVAARRVYRMPGTPDGGGGLAGLVFQPLWVRWMAELAHPDRLQPKLRSLLRERVLREFSYRLSDDQIDDFLHLSVNSGSAGYARFQRDATVNKHSLQRVKRAIGQT